MKFSLNCTVCTAECYWYTINCLVLTEECRGSANENYDLPRLIKDTIMEEPLKINKIIAVKGPCLN